MRTPRSWLIERAKRSIIRRLRARYPMIKPEPVHDPAAGRYLEVTLGWRAEHLEYYVVRTLHPDDHRHILSEFQRAMDDWTEEYVGWFGRKVLGITRVL